MKYELTVLTLWLIAILTTLIIVRDTNLFTYLAPVYFICMVGSIFTEGRFHEILDVSRLRHFEED